MGWESKRTKIYNFASEIENMAQTEGYFDFNEYVVASEPQQRERADAWKVFGIKNALT